MRHIIDVGWVDALKTQQSLSLIHDFQLAISMIITQFPGESQFQHSYL